VDFTEPSQPPVSRCRFLITLQFGVAILASDGELYGFKRLDLSRSGR
jgi:hypothetical protein